MLSTALRAASAWGVFAPAILLRNASELAVPILPRVAMAAERIAV
jgi:hypothetical protein